MKSALTSRIKQESFAENEGRHCVCVSVAADRRSTMPRREGFGKRENHRRRVGVRCGAGTVYSADGLTAALERAGDAVVGRWAVVPTLRLSDVGVALLLGEFVATGVLAAANGSRLGEPRATDADMGLVATLAGVAGGRGGCGGSLKNSTGGTATFRRPAGMMTCGC